MGEKRFTVDYCAHLLGPSLVTMVTVFEWMVLKSVLLTSPCCSQVCALGLERGRMAGRKCLTVGVRTWGGPQAARRWQFVESTLGS